jgi:hypothetical protein
VSITILGEDQKTMNYLNKLWTTRLISKKKIKIKIKIKI